MWFRIVEIKTKQGLPLYLINYKDLKSRAVITSQGRDVTRAIQPMFVYQLAFPNY